MIDAHQHFWQLEREDCVWPGPELPGIYQSFLPTDYQRDIAPFAKTFKGSVLVQSQASDSDSNFLLQLAKHHSAVLAIVPWLDFAHVDAAIDRIHYLRKQPKCRSVRPMLQAIDNTEWILQARFEVVINTLIDSNLRLDALIQMRHLATICRFAQRHPQLPIVINHAAKPAIGNNDFSLWAKYMEQLAKHGNVYCKVSGLVTEAVCHPSQLIHSIKPYFLHLLNTFGAERLMWGSDWPVLNLASNFSHWHGLTQTLLSQCLGLENPNDEASIWGQTAQRFYQI